MRCIRLILPLIIFITGCSVGPTVPSMPDDGGFQVKPQAEYDGPYMLWGEYSLYFDASHESVRVIPRRAARLHLNALKFLEEYCKNCLKIKGIQNNGDGTIDLEIEITHPFSGFPQYTGFDVKGIIMFNGSHVIPHDLNGKFPLYPADYVVSWRLKGDPELLNADGYSYRWSPWYESGSDMPIFNYWEGKFASGIPTANINGYLNFYSLEERHIFETSKKVSRVYHIWLPPGPVVAGYAVEACWVPPDVTPVTDPVKDFPYSANQPEAYHFNVVVNNGEPITEEDPCCDGHNIYEARAEIDVWYLTEGYIYGFMVGSKAPEFGWNPGGGSAAECDGPDNWYCLGPASWNKIPNGTFKAISFEYHTKETITKPIYIAVDLFEVTDCI